MTVDQEKAIVIVETIAQRNPRGQLVRKTFYSLPYHRVKEVTTMTYSEKQL